MVAATAQTVWGIDVGPDGVTEIVNVRTLRSSVSKPILLIQDVRTAKPVHGKLSVRGLLRGLLRGQVSLLR